MIWCWVLRIRAGSSNHSALVKHVQAACASSTAHNSPPSDTVSLGAIKMPQSSNNTT
jgi:hypothetical protein